MNKQYSATASDMFKEAHALTKATIKRGDSYCVNFGQCLIIVKAKYKEPTKRIQWDNVVLFTIGSILTVLLALVVMGVGSLLTLVLSYVSYTAYETSIIASVLLGGLAMAYTVIMLWLVVDGAIDHIKEEYNEYTFKGIWDYERQSSSYS